jgi:hypothetical protein
MTGGFEGCGTACWLDVDHAEGPGTVQRNLTDLMETDVMTAVRRLCVVATVLLACMVFRTHASATSFFVGDFETGNFDQWSICQSESFFSSCSDYTRPNNGMRVETDVVRQGKFAARFEVGAGERGVSGARAEVRGYHAVEGDEHWYQWSTRFGEGFPASQGWTVVTQFHADAKNSGSPPVAFIAGPRYVGVDAWGLVLNTWNALGSPGPIYVPWRASVNPGVWNDITMHIGWSARDDSGFIELWVGGVPQTFTAAPCAGQIRCHVRTLVPGGGGVYAKQGYYRDFDIKPTGVVYQDGFSVADSRDGLVPL